jgi:amino acid adenylation domain-containing protein
VTDHLSVATPGQEQIWFFDQIVPDATFHTVPVYVDIAGPLDDEALGAALTAVVARHEPLRTGYAVRGTRVVPVVAPPADVPLRVWDLRDLPPAERTARAEAIVDDELALPIDITPGGSPLRAGLLRHADEEHRLVLLVHHINIDGTSVALLQTELLECYAAAVEGRAPDLPALPARYLDVAPSTVDSSADVAWWQAELADLPEQLELPNARIRPAAADFTADTLPLVVPAPVAAAIRVLARDQRSSPFMVLLTAFTTLLHRFTGARDLVLGTPVAGRDHPDSQDLVGYFVSLLTLRVRLGFDPTPREVMAEVRDTVLSALDHRAAPFHEVVRALGSERDLDRHPVFQLLLACPPPLAGPATVAGATFTVTQGTSRHGLYDLEIQLPDSGDGELRGWVKFRTARHDRADVRDLLDRFLLVLAGLVAAPDTRLSNTSLLTPAERHLIVHANNATATDYPADASVVELFEGVVDRHPDAVAVEYGDDRLTYAELDRRANGLAHRLLAEGVTAATPVGLYLDRGVGWVVAVLAVLKAGGAYLPLDVAYPAERIAALCDGSGTTTVVHDGRARPRPELTGVVFTDLTDDVAGSVDRPQRTVGPTDLAYVMYTSGSTGTPKGVLVNHRNIARLVLATDYVEFRQGDRVAQASTTTFDAATVELWGALLTGGRLVGMPADLALEPGRLGEWLRANEITFLFLTTSVAMHVARNAPDALGSLRWFVFGGEQPDAAAVATLLAHPGRPEHVVNGYGPTETTTFATAHRCDHTITADQRIPLGRPIANSTVHVLDAYLEPVPPGVIGELHIGGDGVGDGYAGRPDATAERFVPDHLGGRPGARLYRTGDLVRLLPDGTTEYLGRADRQVKIRGFRIEPAEVETALFGSGLVLAAAVLPRVDGAGDTALVGYVVPARPGVRDALFAHLREVLPPYLVPSALVELAALPLTRNGKLDQRALPAPDLEQETVASAPLSATEERLARAWRAVLGTERIGRDTNFFDLGGHSIKATRLVARIADDLAVELPLRLLFDHPTIASLAVEVDKLRAATPVAAGPVAGVRSARSVADLVADLADGLADDSLTTR